MSHQKLTEQAFSVSQTLQGAGGAPPGLLPLPWAAWDLNALPWAGLLQGRTTTAEPRTRTGASSQGS